MDGAQVRLAVRGAVPADGSLFAGITRYPAGAVLRRSGRGWQRTAQWTPEVWRDAPVIRGDGVARYRTVMRRVLQRLTGSRDRLVLLGSSGLDSSFLAALAATDPALPPVDYVVFRPHPDARSHLPPGGMGDEFPLATSLARRHPGRIRVHEVINEHREHPLDTALAVARDQWNPAVNLGFVRGLRAVAERGPEWDTDVVLFGGWGNRVFSGRYPAPLRWAARTRDSRDVLRSLGRLTPRGPHDLRGQVARSWRDPRQEPAAATARILGLPPVSGAPVIWDRAGMLHQFRIDTRAHLGLQPTSGVRLRDPFHTPEIIELAARMDPSEWLRGPAMARGFARACGAGIVPDEIRLARPHGRQSADTWFFMKDSRDRYLDEVAALDNTPHLAGWVDTARLKGLVDSWEWGQPVEPSRVEVLAVNRLLSVAIFVRFVEEQRRRLGHRGQPGSGAAGDDRVGDLGQ